ncbi:formyltransferase family protein [Brevibacillus sp. AG]|uniref:methionyl-tRNA formyltransferase n=1 Tax=Brevibacillus sp. AG TaxID=3020891 RepID=UPI0008534147|nr:formyltransferase family protein [Brevibacillus sp. AG]MDC0761736.1 formyltransferase family protein [Brevibacillus sp. AG]
MRTVFIGCVQFSCEMLDTLLTVKEAEVVGVITRKQSQFNTDFASLEPLAKKNRIPCLFAEEVSHNDLVCWLEELKPDIIYCLGWSYLLKQEILQIPKLGVIGYHPAALPQNRGRHPIIWALAMGLTETASTFFFMDEGADSGDIVSQIMLPIEDQDNARTLYDKLTLIAKKQIIEFTPRIAAGSFERIPQNHSVANYWRKRGKKDGIIDWRMSAKSIHNLVRALTKPYIGAHCVFEESEIKIWRTEVILDNSSKNIEPGKVLEIEGGYIFVKCGEGTLKIIEHDFQILPQKGCYL